MKYNFDSDCFEMSVGELCLSALVGGDIDCRHSSRDRSTDRAQEGTKIHNVLRKSFGDNYLSEVELRNTSKLDGIYFYVKGRADGITYNNGSYTVDEIKTVSNRHFESGEIDERHSAQLVCYAYFLCRLKELEGVTARIIYYNIDDGDIRYNEKYYSAEELRARYTFLLSKCLSTAKFIRCRERERRLSAHNARFPYSQLRESQEEMIKECYRDIKHKNRLFCQAPTGIGKTISTLYPAIKRWGEGYADKIFYLTSKSSIRREAYSAIEKMNNVGARVFVCVLSSRESMCLNCEEKLRGGKLSSNCNPEKCQYASGYYGKNQDAIHEMLLSAEAFDSQYIKKMASKYKICPYELSLDLSELCDIIICDYNYVFSPTVYLKRYFDAVEERGEKYIFLVDEAHNLPERARDIYSSRLSNEDFETVVSMAEENSSITSACLSVIRDFERLGLLCRDNMKYDSDGNGFGYYISKELPEKFCETITEFAGKCDSWLKYNEGNPIYSAVEELSFKVYEFRKICERFDRKYLSFINKNRNSLSVLLYCLDPSGQLSEALSRAEASVLFSATLTPTDYFADILGGGEKSVSVSFDSPFPPENLCVAVVDKISTRYEDRERSYKKIASCIAGTVSAKVGNYMAFFPSYSYMEEVHKIFHAKYPKVKTLVQSKNMTFSEREDFLNNFKESQSEMRIGFCVLGGSFSEGIDLPGRSLIGVMVVGVGLPGLSDENNIIRDYYEEQNGMGYDYAYTYPGMNSVLQAVGRVIRTQTDKGIAVLIDDRYAEPKYKQLFPKAWKNIKFAGNPQSLAEIARKFWTKGE